MKEVFNALNDWVEKLYPELDITEIIKNSTSKKPKAEEHSHKEEQIKEHGDSRVDREIQEEIANLKKNRIFFVFDTGT